jgi:hypothetical protein
MAKDQSQSDDPSIPELSGGSTLARTLKEHGAFAYATVGFILYVSGFAILNSHLARYGIGDFEFVNARYMLAGSGFAFFLLSFYLFAGRNAINTPKWLSLEGEFLIKRGLHKNWLAVLFFKSLISATFGCCLSAALFSATAFGGVETVFFNATLAGSFLITYTFDVTNLDVKIPRTYLITSIIVELLSIGAFFANYESGMLLTVFMTYVAMFMFTNLVLDTLTRHGATGDRISYSSIYSILFILTIALAYGSMLYGNISSKIGGARPQAVQLLLKKEISEMMPSNSFSKEAQTLNGKLIHQTEKFLYISIAETTTRLRSEDVVALTVIPEPDRNGLLELVKKMALSSASGSDKSVNSSPELKIPLPAQSSPSQAKSKNI